MHLLLAFEAAARHLSFRRAAEELHVTPPAITYRIQELEAFLGLALFVRGSTGIQLSDAGWAYYETVKATLQGLRKGTEELTCTDRRHTLRVHILPFLATEVVVPALTDFQRQYPHIDIQIETDYRVVDFRRENVDLAVRFGLGHWDGVKAEQVMPLSVTPVCSARYAQENNLRTLEDLQGKAWLDLSGDHAYWERWLAKLPAPPLVPARRIVMSDYKLALHAAENHGGIAWGMLPLIEPWLKAGRLVTPLDCRVSIPEAYYLVYRETDHPSPEIQAFKGWLLACLTTTLPGVHQNPLK